MPETCTRGLRREICLCGFCAGRTRLAAHSAGSAREYLDERRGGAIVQGEEAWEGELPRAKGEVCAAATELMRALGVRRLLLRPFGTDLYDNDRHGKT